MTIEASQANATAPEQTAAENGDIPIDTIVKGGIAPEDATATADAVATIAADPTLAAAITAAAGGATPALPGDPTATALVEASPTAEATSEPQHGAPRQTRPVSTQNLTPRQRTQR